jgi:hypothetical protein
LRLPSVAGDDNGEDEEGLDEVAVALAAAEALEALKWALELARGFEVAPPLGVPSPSPSDASGVMERGSRKYSNGSD